MINKKSNVFFGAFSAKKRSVKVFYFLNKYENTFNFHWWKYNA